MTPRALAVLVLVLPAVAAAQPVEPAAPTAAEVERRLAESERAIAELRAALEASEQRRLADEERRQADLKALRTREDDYHEKHIGVRTRNAGVILSGFAHIDVAWNRGSRDDVDGNGEPLNETRFLIRRARLRIDADYRWLFGSFEIDANTNKGLQVRPQSFDIGVRYKNPKSAIPFIALHMGLVRAPFGYEVQQSDKERLYLERATMAGAFFPGEYDLGVRAFGSWKWLRYAVAGMNGDPIGERAFPGRDPNESKDFIGNLGVDFKLKNVRIAAAFSGLYGQGFHKAVAATMTTPMSPSSNFARWAVGGDFQLAIGIPKLGALTVLGELIYASNLDRGVQPADPVAAGHELRELGYYVGFTQELTKWAMFGVRWDQYAPDTNTLGFVDGAISTIDVAAGARVAGYARLTLQYLHINNNTGRNADGSIKLTTNDVLTLRGEILF